MDYQTMKEAAKKTDLELLAKEMFNAWRDKHKELYPDFYEIAQTNPPEVGRWSPPVWDTMNENLRQCWIAAAKYAMDEYIS